MDCHTLHNEFLRVEVRALGAALNRVLIRAVDGDVDLLLGHADDADRAASTFYLGALVGPTANRIADGRFRLDGVAHQLATNDRATASTADPRGSPGRSGASPGRRPPPSPSRWTGRTRRAGTPASSRRPSPTCSTDPT